MLLEPVSVTINHDLPEQAHRRKFDPNYHAAPIKPRIIRRPLGYIMDSDDLDFGNKAGLFSCEKMIDHS